MLLVLILANTLLVKQIWNSIHLCSLLSYLQEEIYFLQKNTDVVFLDYFQTVFAFKLKKKAQ